MYRVEHGVNRTEADAVTPRISAKQLDQRREKKRKRESKEAEEEEED